MYGYVSSSRNLVRSATTQKCALFRRKRAIFVITRLTDGYEGAVYLTLN